MIKMADSRKVQLNPAQIIAVALENTESKYPANVAMPAILTELSQPNSDVKQIGNTLFSLLKGDAGQAFFKAFNADTAPNFVKNSKEYVVYVKNDLGMNLLVTEFEDPAISTLFHVIAKNPPMEGMGFKEYKTNNGGFRIVLNLGQ
jgi:hypothetical protein